MQISKLLSFSFSGSSIFVNISLGRLVGFQSIGSLGVPYRYTLYIYRFKSLPFLDLKKSIVLTVIIRPRSGEYIRYYLVVLFIYLINIPRRPLSTYLGFLLLYTGNDLGLI